MAVRVTEEKRGAIEIINRNITPLVHSSSRLENYRLLSERVITGCRL